MYQKCPRVSSKRFSLAPSSLAFWGCLTSRVGFDRYVAYVFGNSGDVSPSSPYVNHVSSFTITFIHDHVLTRHKQGWLKAERNWYFLFLLCPVRKYFPSKFTTRFIIRSSIGFYWFGTYTTARGIVSIWCNRLRYSQHVTINDYFR